jgi:hypothetical protein
MRRVRVTNKILYFEEKKTGRAVEIMREVKAQLKIMEKERCGTEVENSPSSNHGLPRDRGN